MFQQPSFTNDSEDYLSNLLQNRIHNHNYNQSYNHENSQSQNQEQAESDFTPFMKRHSSSGDSYIRDNQYGNEMSGQKQEQEHEDENSFSMDKSNLFSKRYDPGHEIDQQTKQTTKLDDSFLHMVDQHLSHIQKDKENINLENLQYNQSQLNRQVISLSKTQISHALLENQSIIDSIQLTNLLPSRSIAKIINSPFEFRLLNSKNKFIKRDQVEIELEPYETVEIEFQIKRRQAEIGNIYETLKIQTFQSMTTNTEKKPNIQKKYLKFEITFVKPKLEATFLGRTIVKRIQEHKIAHFQIYPNELNEYFINLIFSQQQFSTLNSSKLQRIECQIQAKGYVSVHPTSVILYQNQPLKIVVRKLSQFSGAGKTSAILIKPLHSSLVYVVGVKCMEKKAEEQNDNEESFKMSKFQF